MVAPSIVSSIPRVSALHLPTWVGRFALLKRSKRAAHPQRRSGNAFESLLSADGQLLCHLPHGYRTVLGMPSSPELGRQVSRLQPSTGTTQPSIACGLLQITREHHTIVFLLAAPLKWARSWSVPCMAPEPVSSASRSPSLWDTALAWPRGFSSLLPPCLFLFLVCIANPAIASLLVPPPASSTYPGTSWPPRPPLSMVF